MYELLMKAATELRIAQCSIENDDSLYAKIDELMAEITDLAEEQLEKQVS